MDYAQIMATSAILGLAAQEESINNDKCNLVGASGLIVQIVLGVLSFTVLVYKRIQERPQRQFKIWVLDSAKQVLSALFSHLANMLFSILLTEQPDEFGQRGSRGPFNDPTYSSSMHSRQVTGTGNPASNPNENNNSDPCNYYFVTVIFDTSIGVYLACELVALLDNLLKRRGCEKLRSGNYYKESKVHVRWKLMDAMHNEMNVPIEQLTSIEIDYLAWLTQLAIWLTITFSLKLVLFFLQALFRVPLGIMAEILLIWLKKLPFCKLMFVMVLFPTVMNGLQFWIQDNLLKKKSYSEDTEDIEEVDDNNPFQFEKRQVEFNEAIAHALHLDQQDIQSFNNNNNNNCETRSAANPNQNSTTFHNAGMLQTQSNLPIRKGSRAASIVGLDSSFISNTHIPQQQYQQHQQQHSSESLPPPHQSSTNHLHTYYHHQHHLHNHYHHNQADVNSEMSSLPPLSMFATHHKDEQNQE